MHDARGHTCKAAGTRLDRPVAEPECERPIKHVEHVMEFPMAVRRRTREPGRERAFGEEERSASVFARGLDDDLRRPGVVVLAFSGAVKNRIHVWDLTPRLPLLPAREREPASRRQRSLPRSGS